MPDSQRRLLLRVSLKLLSLFALLVTVLTLLQVDDHQVTEPQGIAPLRVSLDSLRPGTPQRLSWAGGPLYLLKRDEGSSPYLFFDRGGPLNCPLRWYPPASTEAPQQPWPGGFRDQCNATWYRYDGQVLPHQGVTTPLQTPPHRIGAGNLLLVGTNGDNAAPDD